MAAACAVPSMSGPILQGLAGYIDCSASAIGHNGFERAAGGIFLPEVLTSCLVIYVALIGYRMILGQPFGARDAVVSAVRIGLVIALCTSWPSYEALIYQVAIEGPSEIATSILAPSGLATPSAPEVAGRLQAAFSALEDQGVSTLPSSATPTPSGQPSSLQAMPVAPTNSSSLTKVNLIVAITTLAAFLAARLAAGILLALGPIIIALGLFNTGLRIVEGWARALGGAALGSSGVMVVAALELGFVETQAGAASSNAIGGEGLVAIASLFGILSWATLIASGSVARGFRFTPWSVPQASTPEQRPREQSLSSSPEGSKGMAIVPEQTSRAQSVSDAIYLQRQRERMSADSPAYQSARTVRTESNMAAERSGDTSTQPALGASLRRARGQSRTPSTLRRESRR